jgi:hypothetical protein
MIKRKTSTFEGASIAAHPELQRGCAAGRDASDRPGHQRANLSWHTEAAGSSYKEKYSPGYCGQKPPKPNSRRAKRRRDQGGQMQRFLFLRAEQGGRLDPRTNTTNDDRYVFGLCPGVLPVSHPGLCWNNGLHRVLIVVLATRMSGVGAR